MLVDDDGTFTEDKPPTIPEEFVCQQPGCDVELHYGGRGRKPRFCEDHKKGAPKAPTGRRSAASDKLAIDLSSKILSGAVLVMPFKASTGMTLAAFSDTLGQDLAASAQRHPKFKKLLTSNLKTGADAKLALDVGLLVAVIGMNNGLTLPPAIAPFLTILFQSKMIAMMPEITARCNDAGIDIESVLRQAAAEAEQESR